MEETLGDAAAEYSNKNYATKDLTANEDWYISWLAFNNGGKWQADRMYSEEEVIAIVEKSRATGLTAEYLIEQSKKK